MKNTARQGLKIATIPVTLPFDMAVQNYLDRFHHVMDTIDPAADRRQGQRFAAVEI